MMALLKILLGFVRNYNMHNMGKTIGEIHAMLIEYEKGLPKKAETPQVMMIRDGKIQKANKKSLKAKGKNKVNGKGKDKKVYIPKPNNPKPTAKERPAKDDACHHCKEVGHWKRNCHVYLAELQKKSEIERKLKQGALYLYVGNGVRAQVEAIGSFDLVLPNGLVICLDNYHYAPTITRGEEIVLGDLNEPLSIKPNVGLRIYKLDLSIMRKYKPDGDNMVWNPGRSVLLGLLRSLGASRLFKKKTDMDGAVDNIELQANGTTAKYKACLVANGRSEQQGIDCDETFSLVVKSATIRTVLSLAVSRDWPIHQLDANNAFLHGHSSETVYCINHMEEILERAHMQSCNTCQTPIDTESKLGSDGDPQACLYMHDPRDPHFTALKRIFRYVRGTLDYGLQLHVSTITQLSVTLSRSSAEAEYRGVANVVAKTA
ncbi:ribonuclease H-like domain-containing protein [Tanacetum coccineum]